MPLRTPTRRRPATLPKACDRGSCNGATGPRPVASGGRAIPGARAGGPRPTRVRRPGSGRQGRSRRCRGLARRTRATEVISRERSHRDAGYERIERSRIDPGHEDTVRDVSRLSRDDRAVENRDPNHASWLGQKGRRSTSGAVWRENAKSASSANNAGPGGNSLTRDSLASPCSPLAFRSRLGRGWLVAALDRAGSCSTFMLVSMFEVK